jgi:hypothetical protein
MFQMHQVVERRKVVLDTHLLGLQRQLIKAHVVSHVLRLDLILNPQPEELLCQNHQQNQQHVQRQYNEVVLRHEPHHQVSLLVTQAQQLASTVDAVLEFLQSQRPQGNLKPLKMLCERVELALVELH